MEHFYENIAGWFNYRRLYQDVVANFNSGSHFVEVGIYEGMSLAYLIVEIINAKKDITVTGVDSFVGIGNYNYIEGKNLLYKFRTNMKSIENKFNLIIDQSWAAAANFEDKSLDFVFIDASHEYESVKKDILAWLPKVKDNGILAGHDYLSYAGVRQAVDEILGDINDKKYISEDCWSITDIKKLS